MKVLLMGDASNYHRSLAIGLTQLGHEVTVASDGSRWMQTGRDIDLSRREGLLGGAILWLRLNTVLSSRLKGYDVVQIHNPVFLRQRPRRVRAIFDRLRRDNGSVFLTQLGIDTQYVDMCMSPNSPLRYNEFIANGMPTPYCVGHQDIVSNWLGQPLRDHCNYIYDHIDGAVTALYEYDLSCRRVLSDDRVAYGGIPIDIDTIPYEAPIIDGPLTVMVACHKGREAEKGIDRILPVIEQVVNANPERLRLELVQNVPFAEFKQRLAQAHIVVDQLYSYTPATTALMAMASGKVVVSGGEEDYYRFIGEDRLRPIINADPADLSSLATTLQSLMNQPDRITMMSQMGRELVRKHNSSNIVAQRFVDFWSGHL